MAWSRKGRVGTAGGEVAGILSPSPAGRRWEGLWKTPDPDQRRTHISGLAQGALTVSGCLGTCCLRLTVRTQEGAPRKTGSTELFWKWKREAPTCPKLQSLRAHGSSGTCQTLVISHRLLPPLDLPPLSRCRRPSSPGPSTALAQNRFLPPAFSSSASQSLFLRGGPESICC